MKTWNKMQKEGQNGFTGLEREKPCKKFGGKQQKFVGEPCPNQRERKAQKTFWKVSLNKSNSDFKKTWFTIFDWSKQTEASFKILKQFRLIEKQIGSIEVDKGSQNFWEKNTVFENNKDTF